jgi:hypothetical protein
VGEMAEDGKFKVEIFNGKNYQIWKIIYIRRIYSYHWEE